MKFLFISDFNVSHLKSCEICLPHSSMNIIFINFISFFLNKIIFRQHNPIQSGHAHKPKMYHILTVYDSIFYLCQREWSYFPFPLFPWISQQLLFLLLFTSTSPAPSIRGKCSITNSYDLPTVPGILIRILWEISVCLLRDCRLFETSLC